MQKDGPRLCDWVMEQTMVQLQLGFYPLARVRGLHAEKEFERPKSHLEHHISLKRFAML